MKRFKSFIKAHKLFTIQIGVLLFLIVSLVLLAILKTNKDICEAWTRGLGQFHSLLFGVINEQLPFSITDLLILCIIVWMIVLFIFAIINFVHKKLWQGVGKMLTIAITILSILTMYNATFEMAYNRHPLDIPLYQESIPKEKYYSIVEYFVDDLNTCINELEFEENGDIKKPYSTGVLNRKLKEEYKKITSDYYGFYTPTVKNMATSFLYTWFGITGWYFAPTGEAAVNYKTTNGEKPMSYAHEMAHAKGVANEDGAQMVASYICLNSEDPYIRYSGYLNTFYSILNMANYSNVENAYKILRNKVDNKFFSNYNYIHKFWKDNALMIKLGDAINDWYLKISGQLDGTTSYQDNPPEIDDDGKVISLSRYQKLVVGIFINRFPNGLS